jgi:hypothetical protein
LADTAGELEGLAEAKALVEPVAPAAATASVPVTNIRRPSPLRALLPDPDVIVEPLPGFAPPS